jgi:hypothetical protein
MARNVQPSSACAGHGARIVGKRARSAAGPGPHVMAASTLDADKVLCLEGEEVGKVKEIMLDVRRYPCGRRTLAPCQLVTIDRTAIRSARPHPSPRG